jgi:hypothetical protein
MGQDIARGQLYDDLNKGIQTIFWVKSFITSRFSVFMIRAVKLRAVMLRAIMIRAVKLRAVMLRAVMLRAVMLRAVMLRAVLLRHILIARLNVVMAECLGATNHLLPAWVDKYK